MSPWSCSGVHVKCFVWNTIPIGVKTLGGASAYLAIASKSYCLQLSPFNSLWRYDWYYWLLTYPIQIYEDSFICLDYYREVSLMISYFYSTLHFVSVLWNLDFDSSSKSLVSSACVYTSFTRHIFLVSTYAFKDLSFEYSFHKYPIPFHCSSLGFSVFCLWVY